MSKICLGQRLNRLRKRRGYSLEDVGDGVGVTSSHISQIENDKRQPSFKLLFDLANFFDVDPTFFMDCQYRFLGLGAKIHKFREEQGLTLEELASKVSLEREVLEKVEAGEKKLEIEKIKRIAQVLGEELFDLQDSKKLHLDQIRVICHVIFNMSDYEVEETIEFIRKRIKS